MSSTSVYQNMSTTSLYRPAPALSIIIPQNIIQSSPTFVINILLTYDQQSINRISNLITNVYNIRDLSGNVSYADVLRIDTGNGYRPYAYLLGGLVGYTMIAVLKEPFVRQLSLTVGEFPSPFINLMNVLYNYESDEQILEFFTTVFNNRDILTPLTLSYDYILLITTMANNIIHPPPVANVSVNSRTIEDVNRDLTYLTSLGLTQNSDNETMRGTLQRYRTLTGTDYVLPQTSASREDLEKDLIYLFGIGLTPESGNETLNDRLAKWRQLTGEDYVYNQNPSGGRRRRSRKTKTLKRKIRKIRRSRK
jgi:hypothetical protein